MNAVLAALAVAVWVPTLIDGGFGAQSRGWFIVLAGLALLVAAAHDATESARAGRSPFVLALLALALVSIASVAWTIGSTTTAERTGLVIAGYAAVATTAWVGTRDGPGTRAIPVGIGVLAVTEAIIGLAAVAFHHLPEAERLVQTWRPGGTFQYPPALALLQVGALAVLIEGLGSRRFRFLLAGLAGGSLALAGAALGLADSRLADGLAAAIVLVLVARPGATPARRSAAATAAVILVAGAVIAPLALGEAVTRRTPGAGWPGLLVVVAFAALAGGLSAWAMAAISSGSRTRLVTAGALAAVVIAAAAIGGGAVGPGPGGRLGHRVPDPHQRASDFLHGRTHQWSAAIQTWLDRPILGAGAGAYYAASVPHQTVDRSLYAHSLPLEAAAELGIPGLLAVIAIYCTTVLAVFKRRGGAAFWLLGPLAIAFLVSNLVDWTWHLAGLTAIWAAAVGTVAAASSSRGRQAQSPERPLRRSSNAR